MNKIGKSILLGLWGQVLVMFRSCHTRVVIYIPLVGHVRVALAFKIGLGLCLGSLGFATLPQPHCRVDNSL